MTIARYYTPNGRSIQAKGIEPDIVLQHKRIDPKESDEEGLLKEKDLLNHLEADPGKNKKKTDDSDESESQNQEVQFRVGPLNRDRLLTDNQIIRALEILNSYDIFKSFNS